MKKLLHMTNSLCAQRVINKRLRLLMSLRKLDFLFKFDIIFFFDYSGFDIGYYFDFFLKRKIYVWHILLKHLSFFSSFWVFKEIAFKNLDSLGVLCMDYVTFDQNLGLFNLNFFKKSRMLKVDFEKFKVAGDLEFTFFPDLLYIKCFNYIVCPVIFQLYVGFLFLGLVWFFYYYIREFFFFLATLNQIAKLYRKQRRRYTRTKFLGFSPQKKGICVRVYTTKPKKPHSAIRKVAKLYLPSRKRHVLAYIPGQYHTLSAHSVVLIRGGRVRDIPGMHAKMIRGKYDFLANEVVYRSERRSKYGIKRPSELSY